MGVEDVVDRAEILFGVVEHRQTEEIGHQQFIGRLELKEAGRRGTRRVGRGGDGRGRHLGVGSRGADKRRRDR